MPHTWQNTYALFMEKLLLLKELRECSLLGLKLVVSYLKEMNFRVGPPLQVKIILKHYRGRSDQEYPEFRKVLLLVIRINDSS